MNAVAFYVIRRLGCGLMFAQCYALAHNTQGIPYWKGCEVFLDLVVSANVSPLIDAEFLEIFHLLYIIFTEFLDVWTQLIYHKFFLFNLLYCSFDHGFKLLLQLFCHIYALFSILIDRNWQFFYQLAPHLIIGLFVSPWYFLFILVLQTQQAYILFIRLLFCFWYGQTIRFNCSQGIWRW